VMLCAQDCEARTSEVIDHGWKNIRSDEKSRVSEGSTAFPDHTTAAA
jgi:hypothetical protein